MRVIDKPESLVVTAGILKDANTCKSDINNGMAVGGAVGGAIGAAGGVAGASLGTLAGMAFGGGYAAANSPACQGDAGGGRGFTNPSSGGGGGGGGGGGRVICTHLMRQGLLDPAIWRADLAFTYKHLSPTTVRGYHLWAIPYVRLMRKSPLAQKLMRPLATWRAEELAYQMGVLQKSNWKGKVVRWTCEPICFALGIFAKEQNWQGLWDSPPQRVETTSAA